MVTAVGRPSAPRFSPVMVSFAPRLPRGGAKPLTFGAGCLVKNQAAPPPSSSTTAAAPPIRAIGGFDPPPRAAGRAPDFVALRGGAADSSVDTDSPHGLS